MSTHKYFDRICCVVLAITLIMSMLFVNGEKFGIKKTAHAMGYEEKLFDTTKVHTINIIMDEWDEFTDNCKSEEYSSCTLEIDGETYKNVAIRGKGNTSLTQVESYGNDRYSFKVEFDHYDSSTTYHGLDKLCLNNIIQDNTYMKDYVAYQMMSKMGVASPLCSYVYITVNGEDWGLYLAVEGVEESFLQRNYGSDYGELYKPDSSDMGGGRGNGDGFEMKEFSENEKENEANSIDNSFATSEEDMQQNMTMPEGENQRADMPDMPDMSEKDEMPEMPAGGDQGQMPAGNGQGEVPQKPNESQMIEGDGASKVEDEKGGKDSMINASDDVLLKYIDDDFESYSNIFDNAKTDITSSDKERLIEALKKLSAGEDIEDIVDIDSVIKYFVVHNFLLNFDSYTGSMVHNYYLYEKDGQMQMIPWDYNLSFGAFQSMGNVTELVNYPIDTPISSGTLEDRPMINWIFENEEYTELYHKYFEEFISTYFDNGYFEKMIDSVSEMIAPYVESDPTKFCTYEEFETGISTLKEFCTLRAESISKQLDGSIGSTDETQNNSNLVDGNGLQIDDMGVMNNDSMGGVQQEPINKGNDSFGNDNKGNDSFGSDNKDNGNLQNENMNKYSLDMEKPDSAPPLNIDDKTQDDKTKESFIDDEKEFDAEMFQSSPAGEKQSGGSNWLTSIAISVIVLILGLVFVTLFKRRKNNL